MLYQVHDWDDAYANGLHIPRGDIFPSYWEARSNAFRTANPPEPLMRGDLFLPEGEVRGLAVFIHGGYWMETTPATWSHLAEGALARGWAVAMPGYTHAPQARISQITGEVAGEIAAAAERIPGPIALTGHSAGGHLAARMISDDSPLPEQVAARICACVPISPLADLRPLMRTAMNEILAIDTAEAMAESPALLSPRPGIPVTTWVGGMERPEFLRQARLLADIWAGLGASTDCVVEPGRHHYNILDALTRPDSPLTRTLLI